MRLVSSSAVVAGFLFASTLNATISGHVVTEDGKPLAGVRVSARTPERIEDRNLRLITRTPDPAPLATATTDASGAFQINTPNDSVAMLAFELEHYAQLRQLIASGDSDVIVTLRDERLRTGKVKSSRGPVKNALVTFLDAYGEIIFATSTDERGGYSAPDPKQWAESRCVSHPDFAPVCGSDEEERSMSPDTTLDEGVAVKGRVVDSKGKPVANARLLVTDWPLAISAADGTFAIAHAPKDEKTILAVAGDLTGSAPFGKDITVEDGHSITGVVRDARGRGIAGVPVIANERETVGHATTITSSNGQYRIKALAAKQYSVYVTLPMTLTSENDDSGIDLRRRATAQHDIKVEPAPLVRGVVLNTKREPVAGATVMYGEDNMPAFYARGFGYAAATTDAAGRFRVRGGDEETQLTAVREGYGFGSTTVKSGSTSKVTITLPDALEVRGVVVDANGKPIAGAGIVAMAASTLDTVPIAAALSSGQMQPWVVSDPDGAFMLHLPAGLHDLGAWKSGFASSSGVSVNVGTDTKPLRIVLPAAAQIRGRVVRKSGTGELRGQVGAIRNDNEAAAQVSVSEDGTFVLDSLQPGNYMVVARVNGATVTRMTTAPANDVVLELPALQAVRGRVVDASTHAPVSGFKVSTSVPGAEAQDIDNADGRFTTEAPAGSLQLVVTAPGYATEKRSILVDASKAADIEIALSHGRKLHGRIVSSSGQPIPDAEISIDNGSYGSDDIKSDENGEYEIQSLGAGEQRFSVTKNGFVKAERAVPAGTEDQRIDITLAAGKSVKGKVVDASGAPIAKAEVNASSQIHGSEYGSGETDADGAFEINGLLPGNYEITAQKNGFLTAKQEDVDITKNPSVTLTLQKGLTGRIHGTIEGVTGGNWMMAMVVASSEDGSQNGQAGRDGAFVLESVPAGEVEVRAMLMSPQRQATTPATKVTVGPGADVEVHLAVPAGVTVRGRVTSEGTPVPFTTVYFSNEQLHFSSSTTDDGSYEMTGLQPGKYSVSVMQHDGDNFETTYDVTESSSFDINVAKSRIEGRVVDENGAPIADATVTAGGPMANDRSALTATTDMTGAFSIRANANKEYRLVAAKKGFLAATQSVTPQSASSPVTIRMQKGEGIHVRLVDGRSGATLTGYIVVTDERGENQLRITPEESPEGTLDLPLPNGRYRISASAHEFASQTIRVSVPSGDQRIVLTRGGTLVVNAPTAANELIKLVLPNGDEYVRCYCNGIAEIRLSGQTTKVEHVAAGSYRMDVIDAHGNVARSYPVTIAEGQTTVVDAK